MKIDFCGICRPTHKHDEDGMCERHGKPIRNLPMKCIHCSPRPRLNAKMDEVVEEPPSAPFGDACSKCGTPCVGELLEPVLTLETGEETAELDDCRCRLEREPDGTVRLYRCRQHYDSDKFVENVDDACSKLGCKPVELADAVERILTERTKAAEVLGVDDELEGEEFKKACDKLDNDFDPTLREGRDKLLDLVGMTEHDWAMMTSYWESRFNPVEFLVSRLRTLAPDNLAKSERKARRSRTRKPAPSKSDDVTPAPLLRLVR